MASSGNGQSFYSNRRRSSLLLVALAAVLQTCTPASAGLVSGYYSSSCPNLESVIKSSLESAYASDSRIVASITRLFFHDCFVDGCDASILLKDTSTFSGEQSAAPNNNSARGFDVIDDIKSAVELSCPNTVSCADILTITARDSVGLAGGPYWDVLLGRYDSFSASQTDAVSDIPSPFNNVTTLTSSFANVGLTEVDMVVLAGAHTFGKARCVSVNVPGNSRLYNWSENSDTNSGSGQSDPHIDAGFLASLQATCPQGGDGNVLNNLDLGTPTVFDNSYYNNLQLAKGLLNSDEAFYYQDSFTQSLVTKYANDQATWFTDFTISMVNMGNIGAKFSGSGEIRTQCGFPN